MDNRPVQLEKHPVREFYQRNNKVLNTLLMCILVFILGEIIIGAVMGIPWVRSSRFPRCS